MAQIKNSIAWPNAPDRTPQVNQALADWYFNAHPDRIYKPPVNKYNLIGDRVEECRELEVHTFQMGDVDDPDLYAAEPLWQWQQSEFGQWVMKNAADTPTWHRMADPTSFGYRYVITAKFMGPALTEMLLRKGS
jgi:hypothetical protein